MAQLAKRTYRQQELSGFLGIGGSSDGEKRRTEKREKLESVGFNWDRTKGAQMEDSYNIDGWGDAALDNMLKAYQEYGYAAVKAHNDRAISSSSVAEDYELLKKVVERYVDEDDPGPGDADWGNVGSNGSQVPAPATAGVGTGSSSTFLIGTVAVLATSGIIYFVTTRD